MGEFAPRKYCIELTGDMADPPFLGAGGKISPVPLIFYLRLCGGGGRGAAGLG
ncbi:hypothetical protein LAWASA_2373 [Lawsonibacter asaccharolyticus]|nr:hypothetical protein LAWASA_2373 [Lawsonibacter asaccharolyticus]